MDIETYEEEVPVIIPEAMLAFECGLCHEINTMVSIKYGLFFPVSEQTKLILRCSKCGIETTVFYITEDGSNKKSE